MTDTTDKLIVQAETQGVQQATDQLNNMGKAMDGVSVASQNVEKSTTSIEGKFAALERRYGTTAGQGDQFAKIQQTVNQALAQNPALADRASEVLDKVRARFQSAGESSSGFEKLLDKGRESLAGFALEGGPVGALLGSFGPLGIAAGAGIGLVSKALEYMTENAEKTGDASSQLKLFSDTAGLTVSQVRGLNEAGAQVGVGADQMAGAIERFTFGLDEARKGGGALYDQLRAIDTGLADDLASTHSQADALDILAKAYNSTTDATTKAAIARAAFGRNGAGAGAALGAIGDAGGVDDYAKEVQKALGVTDEWTKKVATLRNENKGLEETLKLIESSVYSEQTLERQNHFLKVQIQIATALKGSFKGTAAGIVGNSAQFGGDFAGILGNPGFGSNTNTASDNGSSQAAAASEQAASAIKKESDATKDLSAARKDAAQAEALAAAETGNFVTLLGSAATGAEIAEARFHKLSQAYLEGKFGAVDSADALERYQRALNGPFDDQISKLKDQQAVFAAIGGAAKMAAQFVADYNEQLKVQKDDESALAIAQQQYDNAQTQAITQATEQTQALQDQNDLLKANTQAERDRIEAAQAYQKVLRDTGDEAAADARQSAVVASQRIRAANAAQQEAASVAQAAASAQAEADASVRAAEAWENAQRAAHDAMFTDSGPDALGQDAFGSFTPKTGKQYTSGGAPTLAYDLATGTYMSVGDYENKLKAAASPTNIAASYLTNGNYAGAISAIERAGNAPSSFSMIGGAFPQIVGNPSTDDSQRIQAVDQLYQILNGRTSDKGVQTANLQKELAWLQTLPETIARDDKINQLMQSIQSLNQSVTQNTTAVNTLNATLPPVLSSLYHQGNVSGYGFADGGIMTSMGPLPLRSYGDGGIVNTPQLFAAGERYQPEAIIPLRGGAVPVQLSGAGVRQVSAPTTIHVNAPISIVAPPGGGGMSQAAAQAAMDMKAMLDGFSRR